MKKLRGKWFKSMLTVALMTALVMGAVPVSGVVITARASGVPEPDVTYNSENVWGGTLELDTDKVVELSNINVATDNGSAIRISGNAIVHLVISGSVHLTGSANSRAAGIEVEQGSTLHLYGMEGSSLSVKGGKYGAGIGSVGFDSSSGGKPNAGAIIIHSGTIVAEGGYRAAGIGSGYHQSASEIKIYGGSVTATGGIGGAGIGSGYGTSGGADIGVGFYNSGNITISGGTVSATGGQFAAGIGGGYGASSGEIVIDGKADVTATGNCGGAGIGTGRGTNMEANYDANNCHLSVTIGGNAKVTAIAEEDTREGQNPASGAAIGLGRGWNPCGMIRIEGNASVSAEAKKYAAAIGGSLLVKRGFSSDYVPKSSDIAAPPISIAPTARVSAKNDGTVPAVNGKQMHSLSWPVTFNVVNGAWNDGSVESITVSAEGYEGEGYAVKLTADQIPAVGARPKDTYRAGSWDVTPSVDTEIIAETKYTYTYVVKETAVVAELPKAKTLTYTGVAQELVTAGEATGGEMQYALGNETEATQPFSVSIPTGTEVGTYYVWYKVAGDENHMDTQPAAIEVTISEAPVFSVQVTNDGNGTASANPASGATGTEVTLTAEAKEGYRFREWQVISGGVTVTDNRFTIGSANAEIRAVFEEIPEEPASAHTLTVTYIMADGTKGPEAYVKEMAEGAEYSVASPEVKGYRPDQASVSGIMGAADVTVQVTYTASEPAQPVTYATVSVAGVMHTIGSGEDAVVRVERSTGDKRELELFTGAAVDGIPVPDGSYSAAKGSLILTLKSAYLDTLREGEHKVTISFRDGSAEAALTIRRTGEHAVTALPKTGDGAKPVLWLGMIAAGLAMAIAARSVKKRRDR